MKDAFTVICHFTANTPLNPFSRVPEKFLRQLFVFPRCFFNWNKIFCKGYRKQLSILHLEVLQRNWKSLQRLFLKCIVRYVKYKFCIWPWTPPKTNINENFHRKPFGTICSFLQNKKEMIRKTEFVKTCTAGNRFP